MSSIARATDPPIRVVALGGSMGRTSASLAALKAALAAAEEAGAETTLFDLRELDLPMYSPEHDEPPEAAVRLAEETFRAPALVWASPLYHGTISGAFKNALDWLELLADRDPPYLTEKVVGLISTAGGVQGLQAINTMEFVVRSLRGYAVPFVVPIARAAKAFDEEGRPLDAKVEAQLQMFAREVVHAAGHFAHAHA